MNITDTITAWRRGGGEWARVTLVAFIDELIAERVLRWEDPKRAPAGICLTCQGRRWVMKSESRDLGGGMGAGGSTNAPCPDCTTGEPDCDSRGTCERVEEWLDVQRAESKCLTRESKQTYCGRGHHSNCEPPRNL